MKTFAKKLAVIAATTVISLSGVAFADAQGIQVGLGYRQDSLKWNMRDHAVVNPRTKSNLHFKDLEILLLGAKYKGLLGCSVYTRASFDYGWVLDGRKREKNTYKLHSQAEYFDHNALFVEGEYVTVSFNNRSKDNSYVWDLNFGIGKPIDNCWCPDLKLSPMIGFSYDRHHLKFKGNKVEVDFSRESSSSSSSSRSIDSISVHIDDDSSSSGESCGHHRKKSGSTFQTSFWGPWVGFDVAFCSQGCWNLFGEFELHFGRAERERRSHFVNESIDAFGSTKNFWGPTFRLGANYMFCESWYLEGTLAYQYWMSYGCRDRLYWSSASARVDVGYMF